MDTSRLFTVHIRISGFHGLIVCAYRLSSVTLERGLYVRGRVFQGHAAAGVALRYALGEDVRDSQQLFLARFPHANHHGSRSDPTAFSGSDFGRLCKVLLDPLEQRVHVLPDVFGVELFDDLLQGRPAVSATAGDLRRCHSSQHLLDTIKVILNGE